jgi:hypothetical protein
MPSSAAGESLAALDRISNSYSVLSCKMLKINALDVLVIIKQLYLTGFSKACTIGRLFPA